MASDDNVRLLDKQPRSFRAGSAASFHCKVKLICQSFFFFFFHCQRRLVGGGGGGGVGLVWGLRLNQKMEKR